MKTQLANEPADGDLGFGEQQCPNCGYDLTDFRDPRRTWKGHGRSACEDCPNCHAYPTWISGETEYNDRFEETMCTQCKEPSVQRVRYRAHHQHVRHAVSMEQLRSRVVHEKGEANNTCGSCREFDQASMHESRMNGAKLRAQEKRASQRRGVLKFRREQAKKEKKS